MRHGDPIWRALLPLVWLGAVLEFRSVSNGYIHPRPAERLKAASRNVSRSFSSPSSSSISQGRFLPGTLLAARYRIIALLGRGGMGEVYRADDLTLAQPVALKFLPEALTDDPASLERFRNEVRIARRISHPNVCRIYDIG